MKYINQLIIRPAPIINVPEEACVCENGSIEKSRLPIIDNVEFVMTIPIQSPEGMSSLVIQALSVDLR